jgi:hypothetical protein
METTGQQTWKSLTAGILNIISGAIRALTVIGVTLVLIFINGIHLDYFVPAEDAPFVAPLVSTILIVIVVTSVIEAVFPIIGGVFALQRRRWGWALAGSIIAIFGVFPLGVASTILVAMAKEEYK